MLTTPIISCPVGEQTVILRFNRYMNSENILQCARWLKLWAASIHDRTSYCKSPQSHCQDLSRYWVRDYWSTQQRRGIKRPCELAWVGMYDEAARMSYSGFATLWVSGWNTLSWHCPVVVFATVPYSRVGSESGSDREPNCCGGS